MLTLDPIVLLNCTVNKTISLEELHDLIKKTNKNIQRIVYGIREGNTITTLRVFHYDDSFLGEYRTKPEFLIEDDGTIRCVVKAISSMSSMPKYIIIYTEENKSNIRSVIFNEKKIWGFKDEIDQLIGRIRISEIAQEQIRKILEDNHLSYILKD